MDRSVKEKAVRACSNVDTLILLYQSISTRACTHAHTQKVPLFGGTGQKAGPQGDGAIGREEGRPRRGADYRHLIQKSQKPQDYCGK